jgi:uncharacterized protein (DUF488 family)
MKQLFTIGYEGADLKDFIETLKVAQVTLLLDVRELPASRRKGFSKNALREALKDVGIDYRHEKRLGSPRAIRHRLRADQNYERFFEAFDQHLERQRDVLEKLMNEVTGFIALLCFERDHRTCHRTPVAEALAALTGIKPHHLGVQGDDQRQRFVRQNSHLS